VRIPARAPTKPSAIDRLDQPRRLRHVSRLLGERIGYPASDVTGGSPCNRRISTSNDSIAPSTAPNSSRPSRIVGLVIDEGILAEIAYPVLQAVSLRDVTTFAMTPVANYRPPLGSNGISSAKLAQVGSRFAHFRLDEFRDEPSHPGIEKAARQLGGDVKPRAGMVLFDFQP
jgi:hypothetical protein